jgi:hypothetical protein
MSWRGVVAITSSPVGSWYSMCGKEGLGGRRALNISLAQTGGTDGEGAPHASSPRAFNTCSMPGASLMQWHCLVPTINPPHLRRVTYKHACIHFFFLKSNTRECTYTVFMIIILSDFFF